MGGHAEGRRPRRVRKADRRRSRRVADHVGFITRLVGTWQGKPHLRRFGRDTILTVAYIEADRVLRTKFDPSKGTATTYLSRFLLGFVQYRLLHDDYRRKTPDGWIDATSRDPTPRQREVDPAKQVEADDLIQSLHPDLRIVATRLAAGDSLDQIVRDETFDAQGRRRIPREEIDERVDELRAMLAAELAWIFK